MAGGEWRCRRREAWAAQGAEAGGRFPWFQPFAQDWTDEIWRRRGVIKWPVRAQNSCLEDWLWGIYSRFCAQFSYMGLQRWS
jgi:hypothetical protein